MKNHQVCPKCTSTNLIFIPGQAGTNGLGNHIQLGKTILSVVKLHRWVCGDCGYSEEWLDPQDLPKLKAKFGSISSET